MFSNKFNIFLALAISCYITISNAELCTYNAQQKYSNLITKYPEITNELTTMSQHPISIWYTDKDSDALNTINTTLQNCKESTSVIIIYGMPNKDCAAGESTGGSNKNENDYKDFINRLNCVVDNKEVIYILEPDAISLSMDNGCGIKNNYINNVKNALDILSQNPNAKIYLDIGYWTLIYGDQKIFDLLQIVNQIDVNKKIKGFSLNLSNYRTNEENINSCQKIRDLSGMQYTCVIDTSRNANGPDSDNTWCNLKTAGIGSIPTSNTGSSIIDNFLWLKPAIEVDGHCYDSKNSYQSNQNAGEPDSEFFKILWNNGILKNKPNQHLRCNY